METSPVGPRDKKGRRVQVWVSLATSMCGGNKNALYKSTPTAKPLGTAVTCVWV